MMVSGLVTVLDPAVIVVVKMVVGTNKVTV